MQESKATYSAVARIREAGVAEGSVPLPLWTRGVEPRTVSPPSAAAAARWTDASKKAVAASRASGKGEPANYVRCIITCLDAFDLNSDTPFDGLCSFT